MTYISVGLRILLSIAFLGAGGAKLAGVDMMVMTFDQIGWGQGFRFLTGAIEVIGVALLVAATASGHRCSSSRGHYARWRPDPLVHSWPICGSRYRTWPSICSAVLYIYRTQIPEILGLGKFFSS